MLEGFQFFLATLQVAAVLPKIVIILFFFEIQFYKSQGDVYIYICRFHFS